MAESESKNEVTEMLFGKSGKDSSSKSSSKSKSSDTRRSSDERKSGKSDKQGRSWLDISFDDLIEYDMIDDD